MSAKKWPPPGFPIVEGRHALTADWSIHLPTQFARRIEDGDLVLWRPGLTLWLAAWGNDHAQSRDDRLAQVKRGASPRRFAECESEADGITRYSYRLRDENEGGSVESLYAFVFNDRGQLQIAIYFDDPGDGDEARRLVDGISG